MSDIAWTTPATVKISVMVKGDEASDGEFVDEPVGLAIDTDGGGAVIIEGTHLEIIRLLIDAGNLVANHSVNAHLAGDGNGGR